MREVEKMINILYIIITLLLIIVMIMAVWIYKFNQKHRLSLDGVDKEIERVEKILNNIVINIRKK